MQISIICSSISSFLDLRSVPKKIPKVPWTFSCTSSQCSTSTHSQMCTLSFSISSAFPFSLYCLLVDSIVCSQLLALIFVLPCIPINCPLLSWAFSDAAFNLHQTLPDHSRKGSHCLTFPKGHRALGSLLLFLVSIPSFFSMSFGKQTFSQLFHHLFLVPSFSEPPTNYFILFLFLFSSFPSTFSFLSRHLSR